MVEGKINGSDRERVFFFEEWRLVDRMIPAMGKKKKGLIASGEAFIMGYNLSVLPQKLFHIREG